jgi:hypothetical protein
VEPRFIFDLRKSGEAKYETQCEMDTDVNLNNYSKVYVMVFIFILFFRIMTRSYIKGETQGCSCIIVQANYILSFWCFSLFRPKHSVVNYSW